jgi:hypothetical protein
MPRISGTASGLDPDTTYDFQVRVVNAFGVPGDWSNTAQGTTLPSEARAVLLSWYDVTTTNAMKSYVKFVTPNIGEFGIWSTDGYQELPIGAPKETAYGTTVLAGGLWAELNCINLANVISANPGLTQIVFDFYYADPVTTTTGTLRAQLYEEFDVTAFLTHIWELKVAPNNTNFFSDPATNGQYRRDGALNLIQSVSTSTAVTTAFQTKRITVDLDTGASPRITIA